MQTLDSRVSRRPMGTREKLIESAKVVFAKKGYEGASVKDLAEGAGCNVSLVSYYFDGKEGLYRECLERFGRDRLSTAQRMLAPPLSSEDFRVRLMLFVEEVLETHANEPEISQILHREFDSSVENIESLFKEVFFKVIETLVAFVQEGQRKGFVQKDLKLDLVVPLFMGGIVHRIRVEEMAKRIFQKTIQDPEHRREIAEATVSVFLNGILLPPSPKKSRSKS